MKARKLLPSIYSIVFGVAMIVFSFFYDHYFSAEKFYSLQEGIPSEFGIENPAMSLYDTTQQAAAPYYRIKFKDSEKVFSMRMFGKNYNVESLNAQLSSGKKTGVLFHDEKNENGRYDVYKILQDNREIYSFNAHFNQASSRTVMWIILITGIVFVVFGIFSFRIRKEEIRAARNKKDLSE